MKRILIASLLAAMLLIVPAKPLLARCEVAPAHGGSSKNCGSGGTGGRSSSSDAGTAAALAIGSLLLQGLGNSQSDATSETDQEYERYQYNKKNAGRIANKAEAAAAGAEGTDPWATPKRETEKKSKSNGRAPYADSSCAHFIQRSKGKIDWDFVTIENKCNFPIQVLVCYHMKGEQAKCKKSSQWGTTDTIQPGGKTTSVSTTKSWPFYVKPIVCNMAGVKNHSRLCLLPKA